MRAKKGCFRVNCLFPIQSVHPRRKTDLDNSLKVAWDVLTCCGAILDDCQFTILMGKKCLCRGCPPFRAEVVGAEDLPQILVSPEIGTEVPLHIDEGSASTPTYVPESPVHAEDR